MFISTAKYIYTLEKDFSYATGKPIEHPFMFGSTAKNWLSIDEKGNITIASGYSWDGCSPKFRLFWSKYVIGASDGEINQKTGKPRCYYASLIHDGCYQFLNENFPYSREQIDGFFYDLMKREGFKYADEYYKIVRAVGGFWHKL